MTSSTTVSVQNRLDPRLAELEAEAIDIIRQTAGQFERPALLFSGGKDSVVVLELAKRAFAPAGIPSCSTSTPATTSPKLLNSATRLPLSRASSCT